MSAQMKRLRWWTSTILLLILAFGMRVWQLTTVPPGLTHDEASNGVDAAAILQGVHRIYFPVGYGHEPLYNYSVAATTFLLGQSIFTLRITTVAWGMAQVVLTTALARRWWGRGAAVGTLAAYMVSFWSLMLSRVGLRAPTLPALFAGAVLAYDHAIATSPRPRWAWFGATGVLLGASLYTYMASRGMPLVFVIVLMALAVVDRRRFRRVFAGTLGVLAIAALISAPLFLYLSANPELEQRIGQLGSGITAFLQGDWRPLWANVRASLPMLLVRGDPQWLYNIAGRPGLEPALAVLFVVGIAAAAARLRDRRNLILLAWLAGGLAPALLAPVEYNLLHAVAAMPAAMLAVGLGTRTLASLVTGPARARRVRLAAVALAMIALGATFAETAHAYFVTWARNRNVRIAYHHHVVALGRHLDAQDDARPAVITSLYPGQYHDAYTMAVTLRRADLALRWADARTALFVPASEARLFIEPQSALATPLASWIEPDLEPTSDLVFREDDLPSVIEGYTWDAPASWARIGAALESQLWIRSGDPPPTVAHATVEAPVGFGDTITLEGYSLAPLQDDRLELWTAWQVTASTEEELVIFVHLLAPDSTLVTQDDGIAAPSWQWRPGDRIVHRHTLDVPAPAPGGATWLALGLYGRASVTRIPVSSWPGGDGPPATRVLISVAEAVR